MKDSIYLIYPRASESGTLETLPETEGLITMMSDDLEKSDLYFSESDKVCITSEACLDTVKDRIRSKHQQNIIELCKDKAKFRETLEHLYPYLGYRRISMPEIANLQLTKKIVLKPQKGCFGSGVRILTPSSDLNIVVREIEAEIAQNARVLSESVLSKSEFIIEDYIEGEEYAVDMFFDHKGMPHIVGVYHHPMPDNIAYLHMLYYSSRVVFEKISDKAIKFFNELNELLDIKNFVLHSEFKYTSDGRLIPIEINPMRFAGMGLGNMMYHAVGINPYEHFRLGTSPSWQDIWAKSQNQESLFTYVIAYNGSAVNKDNYSPNLHKMRAQLNEILNECIFNYKTQLAFAAFSSRETMSNVQELLQIEFNDYFDIPVN